MKRLIALCSIALLMLTTKLYAQVDTSTTQKLLQYIMQPLDKSQVPTGILEEYGAPMLPMATFNGTLTDSNRMDMHLWRTLYFQLQTGYCKTGTNPFPAITTVNNTIKNNTGDTVAILLLIGQYNTVKSNAFSSNLLSYNSSTKQVSDVAGRSQSPYDTKDLFAACSNTKQTLRGTETFIVPSNLIWNNTGKTISQLQINFDNGQGFQTVSIGTPVTVSYTDTGSKRWIIKTTLSDNSILQCYADYYVLKASGVGARYVSSNSVIPSWGFINVNGGAIVSINYSKKDYTGTLRKPLIVVEGYDVSYIAPSLQDNYRINDFIKAINEPTNFYDFNHQLDETAGYDLVFIDFGDGADDIVDNAAVVQEVINRVNANKVLDDRYGNIRQPNVVMGLSMGGLCARYALANMTKNFPGTPTETRLLITHDSPHRGANVPLGLQYMIRMMGSVQLFGYNVYDIYPDYDDAIGLLDAPATQQLLLYRAATANTFANNTFLNAIYKPMVTFGLNDPQPSYRFIATANGNECGNPLFNPGKTFVNLGAGVSAGIDARFLFFRVPIVSYKLAAQVEAYALPNTGSTNKIARVYTINNLKLFGFIDIFKQLYDNTAYAPGSHLAIDGVPGSNYPLLDVQALNQLTNLPTFAASLYVTFPLGPFLSGYFGAYAYNQGVSYNFTFVPTASALDVAPYNSNAIVDKYVNGSNPVYRSPSETFIAQETNTSAGTSNNVHIRFTARNSQWLFNEMEGLNNNLNCSSECFNGYYISGPGTVCSSGKYFIPGLPRGATVIWTVSPTGIATINSPNSSQITLTKITDGMSTLTATISNACGTSPISVSKANIVLGLPQVDGGYTSGGNSYLINYYTEPPAFPNIICTGQTATTEFSISPETTVQWSRISANPTNTTWSQSGNNISFYFWGAGQSATFKMKATNACGVVERYYLFQSQDCGGGGGGDCNQFEVSPNPAVNTVTIIVPNIPPPCEPPILESASSKTEPVTKNPRTITEVRLYDNMGTLKKVKKVNKVKQLSMDVAGLKAGVYFIEITDGAYKEKQKLMIQK